MSLICYDIETFPNCFMLGAEYPDGTYRYFEISTRRNDLGALVVWLEQLRVVATVRMVGFNNLGFDYPVVHDIAMGVATTPDAIYRKAMSIIQSESRFGQTVRQWDVLVPQIDLFKIHHFDNMAKATSLKALEFAMRMDNIEDLPFPVGTVLTPEQMDVLAAYMHHDVQATMRFLKESMPAIELRDALSARYNTDMTNYNDTKIGKQFFIMQLEAAGIPCFDGRNPRQTPRPFIRLVDVVFPYITFEHPEFQRVLGWLKAQTITETKGTFTDLSAVVDGFTFAFGTGGIHGSVESQIVASDDEYQIIDADVASYYPNLAIKNRLFPAHLSDRFCDIYQDVYNQRSSYKKGTPENAMLKLALNGVYGDSNNQYSPFYDPQYTMAITINGQLLLCVLAEHLMKIPGLSMVQINTDGLTVRCPRAYRAQYDAICDWWQQWTCLQLEVVEYRRMFIRDVNSYIAEYTDGKLKRKGAYEYKREWHKDHSALIVPKAAEAALVRGEDIRSFIAMHDDPFDFMLRAKVPRADRLVYEVEGREPQEMQRITRYFVSTYGGALVKLSPPKGIPGAWCRKRGVSDEEATAVEDDLVMRHLSGELRDRPRDSRGVPHDERIHTKNRSRYPDEKRTAMESGWLVWPCNNMRDADLRWLNVDYYVQEAEKLVKPLINR